MHDIPVLATTVLGGAGSRAASRPLLVVGPSLGTSVAALWTAAAERLPEFQIVGFDLPGHGASASALPAADMAALAKGVLAAVDRVQRERGEAGRPFRYAGVSVSGCIGLQLLLDAPDRMSRAVILNSAARIGDPAGWRERARRVLDEGVASLRDATPQRWFAAGFMDAHPGQAEALLDSLCAASAAGYAGVCEALATFDVRARLGSISVPVLVIGGQDDVATPPEALKALSAGVAHGRVELLPKVGHLSPAERPDAVAALLSGFLTAAR